MRLNATICRPIGSSLSRRQRAATSASAEKERVNPIPANPIRALPAASAKERFARRQKI